MKKSGLGLMMTPSLTQRSSLTRAWSLGMAVRPGRHLSREQLVSWSREPVAAMVGKELPGVGEPVAAGWDQDPPPPPHPPGSEGEHGRTRRNWSNTVN